MPRQRIPIPAPDYYPTEDVEIEEKQSWRQSLAALLGGIFICVWAITLGLVIASLMTGHWVILPHPEIGETLQNADTSDESITALHFLYADCPCSTRILQHVLNRDPVDGVHEKIVLISEEPASASDQPVRPGYEFETVTPAKLQKRYGIESAPLLVVTNPTGRIIYSGGYTARKQGPSIQDTRTLTTLANGGSPENLPVYGCAVSQELQALLDPLRLKY